MATGINDGRLSEEQIDRLGAVISAKDMTTKAVRYMDLNRVTIANIKSDCRDDNEAFNREIIRCWTYKNPDNQKQKLADILYIAAAEGGYAHPPIIRDILGISDTGNYSASDTGNYSASDTGNYSARPRLERAYFEACREGTKKVYNARMILAGYSEAGKTSLATRLLGEKFNAEEKSTEGIALHRIESTFNTKEKQKKGGKWVAKTIDTSNLNSIFSHAVWSRARKMRSEDSSGKLSTDGKRRLIEDNEHEDTHSDAKRGRTEESLPSGSSSLVLAISDEARKQLIDSEHATVAPELEEETPFTLSVWDLGGQDEFISTHHLFLNTEATILIVMAITRGLHRLIGGKSELGYLNSPAEVLHYWLNLFHSEASKHGRIPNIAIVVTHIDEIKGDQKKYIDNYKEQIMDLIKDKPYSRYIDVEKIFAVSNKTGSESDFKELRDKLLQHLIQQPTWGYDIPVRWLKLKHDIIEKANGKATKYLQLNEVWELGEELRMGTDDIESFLDRQTTLGDFVYFPEIRDLVITEPKWLVDKCKDLITVHEFIDERSELSQNIRESLTRVSFQFLIALLSVIIVFPFKTFR